MSQYTLSKSIRASIISLSLVILPLTLPATAQTGSASSNSSTGTNTTSKSNAINNGSANDANIRNTSNGNSNTATSATSSPSSAASPSDASSSSSGSTGSNNASSSSSVSPSPSSTTGNANTASSQATTSNRSDNQSEWGLLGLLGLIGLAGLSGRTATSRSSSYASDRLEQGLDQARVEASSFWDRLSTRFSESRRRRAREKEIKRIKDALGRPSNRVILDRQDQVILNVGDLITNQAIEQARMANMLDVLLDSVDTKVPEIAEEERSAPVAGEASLEKQEQDNSFDRHRQ